MTDVVVVGGGIAGVSVAGRLAERGVSVVLLERETSLAYHTTGRSAALFIENYGHPSIRGLTRASKAFILEPDEGLADNPLYSPRGVLTVADASHRDRIDEELRNAGSLGVDVRELDSDEALRLVPVLRPEYAASAIYEPDAFDLDVGGMHQAFVRLLRRHGGEIVTDAAVVEMHRTDAWEVRTTAGSFNADVVVNAAGAWGDDMASMAGAQRIGLRPMRRTAFMVPGTDESSHWPSVADVGDSWYFKPDGDQLLCSPADETPCEPCDARPEEVDVALAIDRINEATTLGIRSVRSAWAGLRTFAPDRSMVIGFDPEADGLFWLVGQGGTGIQTAPAAAQLSADMIQRSDLATWEPILDLSAVSPARFH